MDIAAVMALIIKGLGIVETLVEAGQEIAPTIKTLVDIATGTQDGTITQAQLLAAEDELDAQVDEFNKPIPD
jgi:hypothetical protein